MGSDRRTFFNQLVNVGALSGLAAMLPSDAFAKVESSIRGEAPEAGMPLDSGGDVALRHLFHAHAYILNSDPQHPLADNLANRSFIRLPESGGFRSQFVDGYNSGDGVSFKSAYMHVAGTRSTKAGYSVTTLATSVITGLNVHDMVTADIVFAQVSTEHPLAGHVPSVTFLGTRLENLRIAGREVEPVLDLGICGARPDGDTPYVRDSGFLGRVSQQYEQMRSAPGLPDSAREQYHWDSSAAAQEGKVECSLVSSVGNAAPGTSYGHVVEVPDYGTVSVGELTVTRAFNLTLLSIKSPRGGKFRGPHAMANGQGSPGATGGSGSGSGGG